MIDVRYLLAGFLSGYLIFGILPRFFGVAVVACVLIALIIVFAAPRIFQNSMSKKIDEHYGMNDDNQV